MRPGLAIVLLLSAAVCVAQAGDNAYHRWAVVSSAELAKTGLPDLVTVALAERPDMQLVERDRIVEVMRELELVSVLSAANPAQRARLGRLLKADALLLLTRETREDRTLIRAVIADSAQGARLALEFLPVSDDALDVVVPAIATLVRKTRERYPTGVVRIIGVPPLVSRNLVHDYDHLQSRLAHVLESGLSAYPGTAVLEIEEARAIRRELAVSGQELGRRVVPLFVEGEFRVERPVGDEPEPISIALRLTDAENLGRTLERNTSRG